MSLDVAALRAQTPGCERVLHFNNAGMSLPSQAVLDRVIAHLRLEAHTGGYRAAGIVEAERSAVYEAAAALIGGQPDEIALMDSATRAWNAVIAAMSWRAGDAIVVGTNEYGSNMIALLALAERHGVTLRIAPERPSGEVDVEGMAALLDDRVRLIALTHIGTNGGLIQPAAAVGRLAADRGIPYLLDACQSVGQLPVDVRTIGCTMLSTTGRKYLRAPRGTGFLWVRRDHIQRLRPVFPDARGGTWTGLQSYTLKPDARRLELWENGIAGQLGLGVALRELLTLGIGPISARIIHLAARLRSRLSALPGVTVQDRGTERGGLVTFTVDGHDPAAVRAALREQDINVSVSSMDMTRLDMQRRSLPAVVRASVHAYNTEAEIERFITETNRSISKIEKYT